MLYLFAWFLLQATGCVHSYHPMTGLHDAVIVDIQAPNFEDLGLTVYCDPGNLLSAGEARLLCKRVAMLFENQGAEVATFTVLRRASSTSYEGDSLGEDAESEGPPPTTDLTLVLKSREIHENAQTFSWVLCILSSTLIPAVTESTFAIDVEIRDETGFLLVRDTLEGRVVDRFGFGVWATNRLLDKFVRDEEDWLTGSAVDRRLSNDLYGQLSQLLFNAKLQRRVLHQAAAEEGP